MSYFLLPGKSAIDQMGASAVFLLSQETL